MTELELMTDEELAVEVERRGRFYEDAQEDADRLDPPECYEEIDELHELRGYASECLADYMAALEHKERRDAMSAHERLEFGVRQRRALAQRGAA